MTHSKSAVSTVSDIRDQSMLRVLYGKDIKLISRQAEVGLPVSVLSLMRRVTIYFYRHLGKSVWRTTRNYATTGVAVDLFR